MRPAGSITNRHWSIQPAELLAVLPAVVNSEIRAVSWQIPLAHLISR